MDWISRGLVPVTLMMTGDDDGNMMTGVTRFVLTMELLVFVFVLLQISLAIV